MSECVAVVGSPGMDVLCVALLAAHGAPGVYCTPYSLLIAVQRMRES